MMGRNEMENNEKLDIDPLYRAIMPVCFGSGPFIICDDSNCHDACNGENARLREVTIQKRARNSFCCALCGKTNDTPICPKCAGNELIVPRFTPSGRICSLCMNPTTISICPSCADKQKPDARADALAAWSRIKDKIVTDRKSVV